MMFRIRSVPPVRREHATQQDRALQTRGDLRPQKVVGRGGHPTQGRTAVRR